MLRIHRKFSYYVDKQIIKSSTIIDLITMMFITKIYIKQLHKKSTA